MTTDDHATHALHARIRALHGTSPSRGLLDALAAEAATLQRRLDDAEAKVGYPELVPGRWWVVQAPDGSTWASTSDEAEARANVRPGDTLLRQYVTPSREEYRVVDSAPRSDDDGGGKVFTHG